MQINLSGSIATNENIGITIMIVVLVSHIGMIICASFTKELILHKIKGRVKGIAT